MDYDNKMDLNAIFRYAVLIIVGLILSYPMFWMIGSAFKQNSDIFGNMSILPPFDRIQTNNFGLAWQINSDHNLAFYFMNTLKFLVPKTIFTILSCTLTAYVVARNEFFGKKFVFTAIIVTLLIPELAFRIPLYTLFKNLGLLGGYVPLYIMDLFATSSFFVFMEIQFMRGIPKELDEAAKIDGCNPIETLFYVIIPVIKPIIITVALLCFMWGMNDFQGPLIYLTGQDNKVLAQALKGLMDGDTEIIYGKIFAASVIGLTPMIILFFAGSRYFVDGVANTGGKE